MRAQRQAEQRFPVRVRIVVPPAGLGRQFEIMHAWLDETCGPDGWASAPAGLSGIVNDAIAFYFDDAAFAHRVCDSVLLRLSGRDDRGRLRDPR